MGLSPDLKSLMVRGQDDLVFHAEAGRVALTNDHLEPVTASIEFAPASVRYNAAAVDDGAGVAPKYEVTVTVNGSSAGSFVVTDSQYEVGATEGDEVSITVRAVNPEAPSNAGPAADPSPVVKLLSESGDEDNDGQSNADEDAAGTNPRDGDSVFKRVSAVPQTNGDRIITWSIVSAMNSFFPSRRRCLVWGCFLC